MKGPGKVLMLCYFFPPLVASGATRSHEFAKLLPQFGWEPLVLTVRDCKDPWILPVRGEEPAGIHVERTREWNLARLADSVHAISLRVARLFGVTLMRNIFREVLCFPDSQIAWFSTFRSAALARGCDLIYVSCSPFSSALSGLVAKRWTGRPLVVDFRDAWSLNPHSRLSRLQRAMIRRLERHVIDACDALIVNTEGAARLYAGAYPDHRAKIIAIPNGYDALTPVARVQSGGDFVIMHVGSFYGSRQPDLLLECLAELNRKDIVFLQVGGGFESYERFKERLRIRVVPAVPRKEALEMMRQASLLYLKQGWEPGVSEYIAIGAKTYEYLATGLPVLAEVPPGDNAELVRKYASLGYVVTSDDRSELRAAIERAYAERSRSGAVIPPEYVQRFSRRALTGQLAAVFDRLASRTT
jgi:glycosyltransferase involved in cell wall biosynthesis